MRPPGPFTLRSFAEAGEMLVSENAAITEADTIAPNFFTFLQPPL